MSASKRQMLVALYGFAYLLIGLQLCMAPEQMTSSDSYAYTFVFMDPEAWGLAFTIVGLIGIASLFVILLCRVFRVRSAVSLSAHLVSIALGGTAAIATGWAFGMFIAFLNDQLRNAPGLVMWATFAASTVILASMREQIE